jgi:uncharacterized protein YjcR
MKHILVNLATESGEVYISKKDIAERIGMSVTTLWKWQNESNFKKHKQYIIVFNVPEHRALSKKRSTSF